MGKPPKTPTRYFFQKSPLSRSDENGSATADSEPTGELFWGKRREHLRLSLPNQLGEVRGSNPGLPVRLISSAWQSAPGNSAGSQGAMP